MPHYLIDLSKPDLPEKQKLAFARFLNSLPYPATVKANSTYLLGSDSFFLTNALLEDQRTCINSEQRRFYIISSREKHWGRGSFSFVDQIITRLNLLEAKLKIESISPMIVKVQEFNPTLINEYRLFERTKQLDIYQPLIFRSTTKTEKTAKTTKTAKTAKFSALVMDKAPGILLQDIINNDRNGTQPLTSDQRLEIIIELLKTYKLRLFDNRVNHRDIKPDNIFCDLSQGPIKITIIDFNLSIDSDCNDVYHPGTRNYSAPEILEQQPITKGCDIFSLARVIALILGDDFRHYRYRKETKEEFIAFSKNLYLGDLFSKIPKLDLKPIQYLAIEFLLIIMTLEKYKKRPLIEECIEAIEAILDPNNPISFDEILEHLSYTNLSERKYYGLINTLFRLIDYYPEQSNELKSYIEKLKPLCPSYNAIFENQYGPISLNTEYKIETPIHQDLTESVEYEPQTDYIDFTMSNNLSNQPTPTQMDHQDSPDLSNSSWAIHEIDNILCNEDKIDTPPKNIRFFSVPEETEQPTLAKPSKVF